MREMIHDPGQGRMRQVGQQLSLAPERAPLLVGRGRGLLDRDNATEVLVHRLVDCAHAAVAELVNDAIAFAENGVGGKHLFNYVESRGEYRQLLPTIFKRKLRDDIIA